MPALVTFERSISLRGDVVVKVQDPASSRRERLRTLAGRKVGQETGLFAVPEIVSFNDARGEIVFERLHVVGLQEALWDRDRSLELVGRAAEVLAAIHGRMEPGEKANGTEPGPLRASPQREPVPLHGDFGVFNLLLLPASDRMVVIDWANADWTGVDADLAAPEVDIGVFLISLFHRRPFGPWPVFRRHEVAHRFLTTYASASPYGVDIGGLRTFVAATIPRFVKRTRRLRGNLRALSYRHAMVDLALFLGRLSRKGLPGQQ